MTFFFIDLFTGAVFDKVLDTITTITPTPCLTCSYLNCCGALLSSLASAIIPATKCNCLVSQFLELRQTQRTWCVGPPHHSVCYLSRPSAHLCRSISPNPHAYLPHTHTPQLVQVRHRRAAELDRKPATVSQSQTQEVEARAQGGVDV